MRVDIERDRDRGVPRPLLNNLRVNARRERADQVRGCRSASDASEGGFSRSAGMRRGSSCQPTASARPVARRVWAPGPFSALDDGAQVGVVLLVAGDWLLIRAEPSAAQPWRPSAHPRLVPTDNAKAL